MADPAPQSSAPRDSSENPLISPTTFQLPRRNSSIDIPNAWNQPQIRPGETREAGESLENGHLTPVQQTSRSRPASDGGGSRSIHTHSTIHDQGDGEWLTRELSRSFPENSSHVRTLSESRRSTSEDVAQAGTFTATDGGPLPEPMLVVDEPLPPQPELPVIIKESPAPPPKSSLNARKPRTFENAIRAAFEDSKSKSGGKYLPIDAFDRIVTRERVRQELRRLVPSIIPEDRLDWYVHQVWDHVPSGNSKSKERPTSRRKIFSILALIHKVEDITRFIDEKLYDKDLPFHLSDGPESGSWQLERRDRDDKRYPIEAVSSWPTYMLEVFNDHQWKLLTPYLTLSTRSDPEVRHYCFEDGIVLPLIEDEEIASGDRGGYGDVWRVKIHPAHHNCSHDGKENPPYAIKRLRSGNREAFKLEQSNLKRFINKDHLHLIKVLATFEWRKEFYFLFPYADGNLLDFWKLYKTVDEIPRDHGFAVWFSGQCLGIAEGLKMIHAFEVKQGESLQIPKSEQAKTHGRHGDLKPENILWFRPVGTYRTDEGSDMGVLKISDFGLSKFHRTGSLRSGLNNGGKTMPVSRTYRAPEYDIDYGVDQSYDIWTLGCVLIEFVAWYVLGWDEVESFSGRRVNDDYNVIKEDVFFNNVEIVREDEGKKEVEMGAQAKKAVRDEFEKLYKHERSSDFILDLLDFIEMHLLRMGPMKRAKCEDVVKKLAELHERCKGNPKYCTERTQEECRRAPTDLSLLAASALPYSKRMRMRISQNPVPQVSQQDTLPSIASQLAAASPSSPRTPTSVSDRISEVITNLWSLTPSAIPDLTVTDSAGTSQQIETGNAYSILNAQFGEARPQPVNIPARQAVNQGTRTVTPPGGTVNSSQAETEVDSLDHDPNVKTTSQDDEHYYSGHGDFDSEPLLNSRQMSRRTDKRTWLSFCCFPSRRKVHSRPTSQPSGYGTLR